MLNSIQLIEEAGAAFADTLKLDKGLAIWCISHVGLSSLEDFYRILPYFQRFEEAELPRKGLENKACFQNCVNRETKSQLYCEGFGFILNNSFPVHHAWLASKNNKAKDPTWSSREEGTPLYIGLKFQYLAPSLLFTKMNKPQYGFLSQRQAIGFLANNPDAYLLKSKD